MRNQSESSRCRTGAAFLRCASGKNEHELPGNDGRPRKERRTYFVSPPVSWQPPSLSRHASRIPGRRHPGRDSLRGPARQHQVRNSAGNREHTARTYRLEVIELCVGLVRGLVRACLWMQTSERRGGRSARVRGDRLGAYHGPRGDAPSARSPLNPVSPTLGQTRSS